MTPATTYVLHQIRRAALGLLDATTFGFVLILLYLVLTGRL